MSGTVATSSGGRRSRKSNHVLPRPVGFTVEYFDPTARLVKTFILTYFPDKKLQMVSLVPPSNTEDCNPKKKYQFCTV